MPSNRRKQTPQWREFEKLVLRIEQALLPIGAKVRSPDRIRSLLTGRLREVDASIRTKVGTTDLLVTIECRRRRARQDVTWLEQLSAKQRALGIAKTIAGSATPFSADALQVAVHYGIELRVASELTGEDLKTLLFPRSVVHLYKHCELLGTLVVEYDPTSTALTRPGQPLEGEAGINEAIFVSSGPGSARLTINDIWLRADQLLDPHKNVPIDGRAVRTKVRLDVADGLQIMLGDALYPVRRITLYVALSWRREVLPLSQATGVKYNQAGASPKSEINRVEFESRQAPSNNVRLGVQTLAGVQDAVVTLEVLPVETRDDD